MKLWNIEDEEWTKLYIDPKEIKGVSEYNARKTFPDKELDELVISLKETGINTRPVILDENMEVVEGGRRYKAALKAEIPKVFCLKKTMTPREAKMRSFIENELTYPMTNKDRYLFAKDMIENEGFNVNNLALAIGRSHVTVYEWLGYEKLPDSIKDSEAEDKYKDLPMRKKQLLRTTLDSPPFMKDKEAAIELAKESPGIRSRIIEDVKVDTKHGAMDTYTAEKVKQHIAKEKELRLNPNKYQMKHMRFPMELFQRLIKIFKMDYPKTIFEDCVLKVLEEWSEDRERKLGFVR